MNHFKKLPLLFNTQQLNQALQEVLAIQDFPKVIQEHRPMKTPIELHNNKVYYQLCLTRRNQQPAPDCFFVYRGDLDSKSNKKKYAHDKIHINTEIDEYHKEFEYTEVIPEIAHTYFKEVYDTVNTYARSIECVLGRARLRLSYPNTCLDWHTDDQPNVHIPIVTHPASRMIIENEMLYMQPGECWYADVTQLHTQYNASQVERVHMVISIKHKDYQSVYEKDDKCVARYK